MKSRLESIFVPITIGPNIASLKAQGELKRTSDRLGTVYERLSSGQRINRASDDAAGLAISAALNADARVKGQAVRNVADGISLTTIASSALQSLMSIVERQTELAAQAANGTYSTAQRQAMDREFQALGDEYARISQTTSFNGISLFSSTPHTVTIQADKSQIDITLPAIASATQASTIDESDPSLLASWKFEDGSGSTAADSSTSGNDASLPNGATWNSGQVGGGASFDGVDQHLSESNIDFSGSAVSVSFWMNESDYLTHGTIFESSTNFNGSTTGFGLFQSDPITGGSNTLQLGIHGDSGFNIKIYAPPTPGWHHYVAVLDKSQDAANEIQFYIDGVLQVETDQPFTDDNTNSFGSNEFYMLSRGGSVEFIAASLDQVRIYDRTLSGSEIQALSQETEASGISISTQSSALSALDSMTSLRASLSESLGHIGATESRLAVAANYLRNQQLESLSAANRITDADIAAETAALVRENILMQTGAMVLAHANLQPSIVLKLLRQ